MRKVTIIDDQVSGGEMITFDVNFFFYFDRLYVVGKGSFLGENCEKSNY